MSNSSLINLNLLPVHEKVKYLVALEQFYNDTYKVPMQNSHNTRSVRERKFVRAPVHNYYGKRTNKYLTPTTLFNGYSCLRTYQCNVSKRTLKIKFRSVLLKEVVAGFQDNDS